jgi:CheY-like chemotaxis protein
VSPDRRGRVPHVLLVEDNEADADLVRTAIARFGRPILMCVAPTAGKALDNVDAAIAGYEAFALVLLDLNLPDRPGLDLLCDLRERPEMDATPILVLSSSRSPADHEQALLRGASQIMAKHSEWRPFFDGLSRALDSHLPHGMHRD